MIKYILFVFVGFLIFSSCGHDSTNDSLKTNKDTSELLLNHPEHVKNILFAHGYHSSIEVWSKFSNYIEDTNNDYTDWNIYKTNVGKTESVANRAGELADYINTLSLEDDSLVVVAHSMGGLDTHYIISKGNEHITDENNHNFYSAAKKIHKVYTLATPHRGNQLGGSIISPAAHDMGISNTRKFNAKYPYSTYSIDARKIPLLAFRFHCGDAEYSDGKISNNGGATTDGTVAVKRQILFGAPHTQTIFHAKHTDSVFNRCNTNILETELTDTILKGILDNKQYYVDKYDIVFYEDKECKGEEDSFYSSTYTSGRQDCGINGSCSNDKISSIKIYPSIKENTTIELYDSPDEDLNDDWIRIHIGKTNLSKPFCIKNIEHNSNTEEKNKNISIVYYKNNGLNGKVSVLDISKSDKNTTKDIVFYEKLYCKGETNGYFTSKEILKDEIHCQVNENCSNDKISSIRIYPGIQKNMTMRLYDNPDFGIHDDWMRIHIGKTELKESFCINNLEHHTKTTESDKNITVSYYNNNGLNGKVSSVKFDSSSKKYSPIDIVVHEDDNCKGDIVSSYNSRKNYNDKCGSGEGCNNDAAKSIRLYPHTNSNITITLYNDGKRDKSHGYTVIKTGNIILEKAICINGFDNDYYYSQGVTKKYHKHTNTCITGCGVTGKVSYINIKN